MVDNFLNSNLIQGGGGELNFKFQLNSGGREIGSPPPACFLMVRNIKTVRR